MVRQIEEVGSKDKVYSLTKRELSLEAGIPRGQSRTRNHIPPLVSRNTEGPLRIVKNRRSYKGAGIEPLVRTALARFEIGI